jgi:PAT family beta-lactamase induction signal transducer AmpG
MAWLLNIGLLLSLFGILLGAGLDYRSQRDLQQPI